MWYPSFMAFQPRHAARSRTATHPAGAAPLCPLSRRAAERGGVSRPVELVNASAPVNAMSSRGTTLLGFFPPPANIREPRREGRPTARHLHPGASAPAAAGVGARLRPRSLRHSHGRVRSVRCSSRSLGAAAGSRHSGARSCYWPNAGFPRRAAGARSCALSLYAHRPANHGLQLTRRAG